MHFQPKSIEDSYSGSFVARINTPAPTMKYFQLKSNAMSARSLFPAGIDTHELQRTISSWNQYAGSCRESIV